MTVPNGDLLRMRQRNNALQRFRSTDDPELVESRRTLAEASIAAYVAKQLASAPPLRPDQRDRLSALFRPARAERYDAEIDVS